MIKLRGILETINIKKLLQQTEVEAKDLYDVDWDKLTPEICKEVNEIHQLQKGSFLYSLTQR